MDKEQELQAARDRVTAAKSALSTAQAALTTAEAADPKDDAKITQAKSAVEAAEGKVTEAEAEVITLGGDDSDEPGAGDIVDDIIAPKKKLADGTAPDKEIKVSKDKFDDLNEKAKLLEQFAPVLAKLQKDPALVERLMAGDDPSQSVPERLAALEKRERDEKRTEVTTVINAAMKAFPDFKTLWPQIKPILAGLEAQGISYADAVERSYFAVNPEAAAKGVRITKQLQARERENARGKQSPIGGGGPRIRTNQDDSEIQLSEADLDFARATGLDPSLYAKHAEGIKRFADL